jgi:hypothetical protein
MSRKLTTRVQPPLLTKETLDAHRGEWVAFEHGKVTASAPTERELYATGKVRAKTSTLHVASRAKL